jgi:hypothetical protein
VETLAPSHQCVARMLRRRSGGVVITTYAAAIPANPSTTFAVVRAVVLVIYQLRRVSPGPNEDPVPNVEVELAPGVAFVLDEPVASRT